MDSVNLQDANVSAFIALANTYASVIEIEIRDLVRSKWNSNTPSILYDTCVNLVSIVSLFQKIIHFKFTDMTPYGICGTVQQWIDNISTRILCQISIIVHWFNRQAQDNPEIADSMNARIQLWTIISQNMRKFLSSSV